MNSILSIILVIAMLFSSVGGLTSKIEDTVSADVKISLEAQAVEAIAALSGTQTTEESMQTLKMAADILSVLTLKGVASKDAAELVLHSGAKLLMFGLDVTTQACYTMEQLDALAASGTRAGRFAKDCNMRAWRVLSKFGLTGFCMHDSCPVMYLAHPELFAGEMAGVVGETKGTVTLGKSVTDLYSDKQFPFKNAFVVLKVDREKFLSILTDAILSIG